MNQTSKLSIFKRKAFKSATLGITLTLVTLLVISPFGRQISLPLSDQGSLPLSNKIISRAHAQSEVPQAPNYLWNVRLIEKITAPIPISTTGILVLKTNDSQQRVKIKRDTRFPQNYDFRSLPINAYLNIELSPAYGSAPQGGYDAAVITISNSKIYGQLLAKVANPSYEGGVDSPEPIGRLLVETPTVGKESFRIYEDTSYFDSYNFYSLKNGSVLDMDVLRLPNQPIHDEYKATRITVLEEGLNPPELNLPDLYLEDVRLDTENPKVGDKLHFSVKIKNDGTLETGEYNIQFNGSKGYGYSSIESGQYATFNGDNWRPLGGFTVSENYADYHGAGIYTFTVTLDFDSKIQELDENNNSKTISFYVAPKNDSQNPLPDLVIEDIRLDNNPKIGDKALVSIKLKNIGNVPASSFEINAYTDKIYSGVYGQPNKKILNPGEYYSTDGTEWFEISSYAFQLTQKSNYQPGYYTFTVAADLHNQLKELDETNNYQSFKLYVPTAGDNQIYPAEKIDQRVKPLLPDLVVEDITFYKELWGNKNFLSAKVCNRGTVEYKTDTLLGDEPLTTEFNASDKSASRFHQNPTYYPQQCHSSSLHKLEDIDIKQSGYYNITVKIDSKNVAEELNEYNNKLTKNIYINLEEGPQTPPCATVYDPVCGVDGKTYSNSCTAGQTEIAYQGVCQSTLDLTPRISYWYGKVNQHTENGVWKTDSDGISGANLDKLTYCQKWYPDTTDVIEYKKEMIDWKDRGNTNNYWPREMYKKEVMSYKCIQGVQEVFEELPIVSEKITYQPKTTSKAQGLLKQLEGKIILQVESHGEAYYIDPDINKIYYLKDGQTAYEVMKETGLGISEIDFLDLMSATETGKQLRTKLAGRIVLRVHARGEAYYINPENSSVTYMPNGEAAYKIMREQSLGISNRDLSEVIEIDN